MRELTTIKDPGFDPKTRLNFLDNFFIGLIKDPRDLPFIYLIIKISLFLLPISILLYTSLLSSWAWWLLVLVYAGLIIYYVGPYTLMLHNTSHRTFFKRKYRLGNYYIPWILGPVLGQSPETYFSHHIGMHHAENNLHSDKSSTMKYQRDSALDFLKYSGSFLLIGVPELVVYFQKKQFWKFVKMIVRGETIFILVIILLSFVSLKATFFVFLLPTLLVRFFMMAGNWGQHAFVDPETPENNYRNSITCVNSAYNKKCFNDGYHIGHHLRPHMHWTEMPCDFLKNKLKYADEKAIVYEGLDFHMVWVFLMFKRYDILANHFVNIDKRYSSKAEIIALLKTRTQKIEN